MATRKVTSKTSKSAPKKVAKTSTKEARVTPAARVFSFAHIFRTTWNKSVAPLQRVKLPTPLARLGLGKDITYGTLVLLVILLTGCIVAFFFGNQMIYAFQKQTTAAIVNGETVSKPDLDHRLEQSYGSDTVQKMVDETLVMQEGRKEKITVSQDEINSQKKQIEQQIAPESLADALSSRNLTMSDLERQIKIQIIIQKILGPQVQVSDSDLQSYFDQNKDNLAAEHNKKPEGLTLNDVKDEVNQAVRNQKISDKYQSWIADLRSKATIKTF